MVLAFHPPRCPKPACVMFENPVPGFYKRNGWYRVKNRPAPVQRFKCRACRRGFSRQTFRVDFRDHKPHLNVLVFSHTAGGVGMRQIARLVLLTRKNLTNKWHKLGRHLGLQHENLLWDMPERSSFVFDELITYEQDRCTKPVTMPIVVEASTGFVVTQCAAPIRPGGKKSPQCAARIARQEATEGPRPDGSKAAVTQAFAVLDSVTQRLPVIRLVTDEKPLYGKLARERFGVRLEHVKVSGLLPRIPSNPLQPINFNELMMRDLLGRLRPDSWLVSKKHGYGQRANWFYASFRNFVRRRVNRVRESPAMVLGFTNQRWKPAELLAWRQDWGQSSIYPLSSDGTTLVAHARAGQGFVSVA